MDIRPITSVDALIALLAEGAGAGDDTGEHSGDGERVDLLAHALQCAAEVARSHPADAELQVAALVHDIGHQVAPGDDAGHGIAGALAVRSLLGDRVARLVAHHVPAKRFLVAVDPDYRATLSPVSLRTLERQGGTMSAAEVADHERLPDWSAGLSLRRADEAAKRPGREVPGLEHWRPVLDRLAAAHRG